MKILNNPHKLNSGDYLTLVDYETNEPGYGKDVKDTILTIEELYQYYLKTRATGKDDYEESQKCYCGHTQYCSCSDLTIDMFKEHLENGEISFQDDNGWQI